MDNYNLKPMFVFSKIVCFSADQTKYFLRYMICILESVFEL